MDNNWEKQYIAYEIRPQPKIYGNNNAESATMVKNVPKPSNGPPKSQSVTPINQQLQSNRRSEAIVPRESSQT